MRRWLAMTLRRFCALLGWTGIRRWSQAIARVEQAEAAAAAAAPDARPASGSGAEAGYDLGVTWNAATASVGVTRGGTRKLWAEGRVEGQRSQRVYLAPKRGGRCHLVFLPHRARAGRAGARQRRGARHEQDQPRAGRRVGRRGRFGRAGARRAGGRFALGA